SARTVPRCPEPPGMTTRRDRRALTAPRASVSASMTVIAASFLNVFKNKVGRGSAAVKAIFERVQKFCHLQFARHAESPQAEEKQEKPRLDRLRNDWPRSEAGRPAGDRHDRHRLRPGDRRPRTG